MQRHRGLSWITFTAALTLLGCGASSPPPKPFAQVPTLSSEAFLTAFLERYPADYRAAVVTSVGLRPALEAALSPPAASSSPAVGAIRSLPPEQLTLRLAYLGPSKTSPPVKSAPPSTAGRPPLLVRLRFVQLLPKRTLSPAGELLFQRLRAAREHALDPARYSLTELGAAKQAFDAAASAPALKAPTLRTRTRSLPLWNAIEKLGPRTRALPRTHRALFERLVGASSPVPEVARSFARAKVARRAMVVAAVRLELTLAQAFLAYSRDLGRANLRPATLRARWKLAADRRREALAAGKGVPRKPPETLPPTAPLVLRDPAAYLRSVQAADLRAIQDATSLERVLRAAEPPHRQYRRLLKAARRYRAIVAAGGWKRVRRLWRLRIGRKHRRVSALKRRLIAEGYYKGEPTEVDDRVDEALIDAVEAFQATHQLKETTRLSRALYRELNVPASKRLSAILESIGRWRRSGVGASPTYLRVDVPDYHLEVWRRSKRLARHRIVVGRARGTTCDDETKQRVLRFATPLQSALLERLIFAPFWNVTATIKQTELDPERAKDGLYYEKNGYELMRPGTPQEWVRQLPGPGNSLGFVKFIFPNPHATFVHDTPEKRLFERPVRAFSHGCMRVENAWSLAKVVLTADGQWRERAYRKLYEDWRHMGRLRELKETWDPDLYEELRESGGKLERKVELRRPIPVHVEYTTVRVADDGAVQFHQDIYGLAGGRRIRGVGRRCVPEKKRARWGFADMLTKVTDLEQRAMQVAPLLLRARGAVQLLSPHQRRRHYWLVKQVEKKLARFSEHHANLARTIRSEHGAISQALAAVGKRWRPRLTQRAVALQRLFVALSSMTARAERVCKRAAKLSRKKTP